MSSTSSLPIRSTMGAGIRDIPPNEDYSVISSIPGSTSELLKVDLIEGLNSYTIICDMPGVSESDLDLTFDDRDLSIRTKRIRPLLGKLKHGERQFGRLNRRLQLPLDCVKDSAKATMCPDGVLKIVFDKIGGPSSTIKKIQLT